MAPIPSTRGRTWKVGMREGHDRPPHRIEEQIALLEQGLRDYAIIGLDPDGTITTWDPSAAHIFGWPVAEILGQPGARLFTPEDVAAGVPEEELQTALRDGRAEDERWHLRRDGGRFWASGVVMPLRDEDGRHIGFMKVARDATARKRDEEERDRLYAAERAARQRVQEAVAAREAFIGNIAHDLQAPIATIRAQAELAQRRLDRGTLDAERLARTLAGLVASTDRMARMIQDLRALARLEGGAQHDVALAPVDLVALVQRVAGQYQDASERHVVTVEADAPELVGLYDAARLERVLENLIANAIKYSPAGGAVALTLSCEERDGRDWARVGVQDHGVGIPARDLPRLFERFHRGSNVAGQIEGSGLGLAGARQIVEQHGGSIAVDSAEGVGTTVTVRLPLL